ncbi:MAG TPA: EcsC family protein [Candidatus Polarisedimenticolaceae bacterium]|nr:EcsC family protein [Candidatus Polarisedimenticolaceae bacterium]
MRRSLERALRVALGTTRNNPLRPSADRLHALAAAATGAVGGMFGLPGLIVELPATTVIMLRSIAEVARSDGADLDDPINRVHCLEVFALGRTSREAAETGYFAARGAIAAAVGEAAHHVATRGISSRGAPALVRLVDTIATRFGVVVQEKLVLELLPLIGAASGAAINTVFIAHFQHTARGHFIVRRLEDTYGPERIRESYRTL